MNGTMHATIRTFGCLALVLALALPASESRAATGTCAQPFSTGSLPTAGDSLFVLRAAVALETCNRCLCDLDDSGAVTATDALGTLRAAVGLEVALACPQCDPDGEQCPGVAQFALFAAVRGPCTTNADCAAFSVCDPSIGRCRTATDIDVGWTGLGHDGDGNDPVPARVFLDCEGPAPCGQCTITGHDPSLGNCRCANDNRQRCFTVAGPDEENCGGGQCICNFGPPMPLSSGNTPICVLNTLSGQPGGEANVDLGTGRIELHLAEKVYLGIALSQPCPVCVNDSTPADGQRDGVCVGGANDGQDCDAQAYNSTFPPPTGALYSLDCMPLEDANVTGSGLKLELDLTTGRTELAAGVPCGASGEASLLACPCRLCSGDISLPCRSDGECEAAGAGTCSSDGGGAATLPNACTNGVCEDVGGGEGLCVDGPDDTFCDAVVRADGRGLIGCGSDEDCQAVNIGIDAGACTLVERRPCFLDPIVSQGAPHPVVPLGAGTFCSPATSAPSVNLVGGLPGPGRLTLQTAVSLFCRSDPASTYTPGSGGCP